MRKVISVSIVLLLLPFLCVKVRAIKYEYSFDDSDSIYSDLREAVPENLKSDIEEDTKKYDFGYFSEKILSGLKKAAGEGLKGVAAMLCIVVIAAGAGALSKSICEKKTLRALEFCEMLCMTFAVWKLFQSFLSTADILLKTLSETMLGLLPVMEGALICSGNAGSAAVQGTGINLMIAFGESVFSRILFPGAVICFFLSVAAAVSENGGIAFMSKTLRALICGVLILVMTLMTFVLVLQNGAAGAADTFAARTLKFAISSYIPIVGGTVSESFSCLAGSLGVIKETCGVTGIVVLFLVTVPPMLILCANRVAMGISRALAGALGCEKLEKILGEACGTATLIIAVCAGGAAMFMISLGVFCRTAPALGL